MKTTKQLVKGAAIVAACLAGISTGTAQVLFQEDWEGGTISPAAWKAGGTPIPGLNSGSNASGLFSMINNGDGINESGLVTVQTFAVVPGLRFDFSTFTQTGRIWSGNRIWLSTSPLSQFGSELYGTHFGPQLLFLGDTPNQKVLVTDGSASNGVVYNPDILDRWVSSSFLFNADGSLSYFVDNALLHTSTAGWFDYSAGDQIRLVFSGRSNGVVNLVDDIRVSVALPGSAVPEPSTTGVVAAAACLGLVFLRRRR